MRSSRAAFLVLALAIAALAPRLAQSRTATDWSLTERAAIEVNNRETLARITSLTATDLAKSGLAKSKSQTDQRELKALTKRWSKPSDFSFITQANAVWLFWRGAAVAHFRVRAASADGVTVSWGESKELHLLRRGDLFRSTQRWLDAGLKSSPEKAASSAALNWLMPMSSAQTTSNPGTDSPFRDLLLLWAGETAYREPLVSTASNELFRGSEVPSSSEAMRATQARLDIGPWTLQDNAGFLTRTGHYMNRVLYGGPDITCKEDGTVEMAGRFPQDGSTATVDFRMTAQPDGTVLVNTGRQTLRLGPKRTLRRGERTAALQPLQTGCDTRALRARIQRAPQRDIDTVELRDLYQNLNSGFVRLCQSLVVQNRSNEMRPVPGRPDCKIELPGGVPTANSLQAWADEFESRCRQTVELVESLPMGWTYPSVESCLPQSESDDVAPDAASAGCPSAEDISPDSLTQAMQIRPQAQLQADYEFLAAAERQFLERVDSGRFVHRARPGVGALEPTRAAWLNLTSTERIEYGRHSNAVSAAQERVLLAERRSLEISNQLYMLGSGLRGCCGSSRCREELRQATGRRLVDPPSPERRSGPGSSRQ
jgi:hypothetical protein